MTHLSGGKVNVALIQEVEKRELIRLLEKCDGTKAIVWDTSLERPVSLVAQDSLLKEHGVGKRYPLIPGPLPPTKVKNVIFITRPSLHLMNCIISNLKGESVMRDYHLIFVPRKSLLCERRLEVGGVLGNFKNIEEFCCDLFPLDNDLMSMELDGTFKEYYLEGDPTCLFQAAQALGTLQALYGPFGKVSGKGAAAKHVYNLLLHMDRERQLAGGGNTPVLPPPGSMSGIASVPPSKPPFTSIPRPSNLPCIIDHVLLLDRAVDLLSPLATQLTYEGLIDEIFGIQNSIVEIPSDKFSSQVNTSSSNLSKEIKQIELNSGEELFAEIRDKNFNAVGPALRRKANLISSQLDARSKEKTIQEMKQFVARLPHILASKQSLEVHTTIAELIKENTDSEEFLDSLQKEQEFMNGIDTDKIHPYIEDLIAQKVPLIKVLRLLCIQSVTNSGLKPKVLDHYRREIIQTYGFENLLTMMNLEKAGLLKTQQSARPYTVLRKTLRLTVEDGSETDPTDISYVHSLYAPISVRLAQALSRPTGWKSIQDVLGLLPGPAILHQPASIVQTPAPIMSAFSLPQQMIRNLGGLPGQFLRASSGNLSSQGENPKVILVFFLGGCTFAEISALRFLSQQEDSSVEFVIVTTNLVNGNTFIESLMEPLGQFAYAAP
ncbi:vacuolar protein sorting-associated protein 33A-like isoform X2 [Hetaerina americana]|uniref:vacuolar protein sorting-associated protein 33A-like isoform X2 n=1 Tax=Hetaerina americana TaxID=62018 RepID=UPI003A7F5E50